MKYQVNKEFFKTWSNEMAYILGVIASDGCIQDRQFRLGVNRIDYNWLCEIKDEMKSSHPIYIREKDNICLLCIGNSIMVNDLQNLGIMKNKTYLLESISIPKEYFSHFVRGYFDGDGSLTVSIQKSNYNHKHMTVHFISNNEVFLFFLREEINKQLGFERGSISHSKRSYSLRYNGNASCKKLLNWMYTNSKLKLERKYQKYIDFLE